MKSRIRGLVDLIVIATVLWVGRGAQAQPRPDDVDPVFGRTRIWQIHLHVTGEAWKQMQPKGGGFPFGPGGPGRPAPGNPAPSGGQSPEAGGPALPNRPGPAFRPGSFGYEFDYVSADIALDGRKFSRVGLRFKGNGTYMMSAGQKKRPFKVDFNRFVEDQRFHGLQQINLHNNVMDPTQIRQALSYPVFQAAGVPAPRTAFAEVTLTIEGECDHEPLGLYTLVEEIDKAFLKRHFSTAKGLLLKPEGTQGLEYKGDDWASYSWFEAKTKPRKEETDRLINALRLIHKAGDDEFRREIGTILDLDEFAAFLAANCLLANMDSFLTHVHNYYVYLPPQGKAVLLPWDLDLSLGAFFMAGTAEQLQDLSIAHPHVGSNRLLDRLMEWDAFVLNYRNRLRALNETCFAEGGQTWTDLHELRRALQPQLAAAQRTAPAGPPGFGGPGLFGATPDLNSFLVRRHESVKLQLEGKSQGQLPGMSFGPRGPGGPAMPGGGPGPLAFGPGRFHGPQILEAADTDRDKKLTRAEFQGLAQRWLKAWDEDDSAALSQRELTAGLNTALAPPAIPGGFRPPPGFGPGNFLAPPLLKLADGNADSSITGEEWNLHFEHWFHDWDQDKTGHLTESQLVDGLNRAFRPAPPKDPPSQ